MKYTILSPFENLPYFTIEGFRQIAGDEISGDAHAHTMLSRWVAAGRLVALKRGLYMHRRFFERHRQEPVFSQAVSAVLQPQSYLSLEYILQQHGILTEITYPITAATAKGTRIITNPLGTFAYHHIQPELYRGFRVAEAYGIPYARASLAKALFDFLYLRPQPAQLLSPRYNLALDLRLNLEDLPPQDREEFAGFVELIQPLKGGLKMRRILNNLENHVWRP